MQSYNGRVAVVTGGSAGIGAATTLMLAARGADVLFCARNAAAVLSIEDRGKELTGSVRGFTADLADADSTAAFLNEVDGAAEKVDILVNNVGASPSMNFLHAPDAAWDASFQVNLMSAVRCTRHFLPAMRRAKWGRVVMVSTGAAKHPSASLVDYAASKAALVATGKALARKYGADNVLINSILPGLILTSMWERASAEIAAASGSTADNVIKDQSRAVPLGRFGDADEVAELIAFLCSDAASYVSGAAIEVDGALSSTTF